MDSIGRNVLFLVIYYTFALKSGNFEKENYTSWYNMALS